MHVDPPFRAELCATGLSAEECQKERYGGCGGAPAPAGALRGVAVSCGIGGKCLGFHDECRFGGLIKLWQRLGPGGDAIADGEEEVLLPGGRRALEWRRW
jgi:hypothetical protein